MRSALRLLAMGLALAAAAPAQVAASRRPTFARVVDGAGQPAAGARITFAGGLPQLGAAAQAADVVTVVADARGRADARLRSDLCYLAWAVLDAEPVQRSMVSAFLAAGAIVDLQCEPVDPDRIVPLVGIEPWADQGPLRCFLTGDYPGVDTELPLTQDGGIAMPLGSRGGAGNGMLVCTQDGQPLWWCDKNVQKLQLPPPWRVTVQVVDEADRPLADVPVRHRVRMLAGARIDGRAGHGQGVFRELGRTGADGRLEVTLPYPHDPLLRPGPVDLLLFAAPPGRPAVAGGIFSQGWLQNDHRVETLGERQWVFRCPSVAPLRGHWPKAPAGSRVQLAGIGKLHGSRDSFAFDARSFFAEVGADGSFAFADVPEDVHSCRLALLLPPEHPAQLVAPVLLGRALPPGFQLAQEHPAEALRPVPFRLAVKDPDGGPASGAVALLVAAEARGVLQRDNAVRVPLDGSGNAALRLYPGDWLVCLCTPHGYAAAAIHAGTEPVQLALAMQPLARMQLRLLDAESRPVVGARLRTVGSSTRSSGDAIADLLQSLAHHQRSRWEDLKTGADGVLVVEFLPAQGLVHKLAFRGATGVSDPFELRANDEPQVVRLRQ